MTDHDEAWVRLLFTSHRLSGPVLELGAGLDGHNAKKVVEGLGLKYYGTDVEKTAQADFVANFERAEDLRVFNTVGPFGTVLVLNVLEHTFDPIRILDNCMSIVKPDGACAVIVPAIWPIHDCPIDVWRPLPAFYVEYAKRRGLEFLEPAFDYVGFGPVRSFPGDAASYYGMPPAGHGAHLKRFWSRAVHRAFNTFGRGMSFPSHVSIGAVFIKNHVA